MIIISEHLVSEPFLAEKGNGILHVQREVNSGKEGINYFPLKVQQNPSVVYGNCLVYFIYIFSLSFFEVLFIRLIRSLVEKVGFFNC